MAKFKDLILTELGNTTDGYDWSTTRPGNEFKFYTEKYEYIVKVSRPRPRALQVSFKVSRDDIPAGESPFVVTTNEGNAFQVIATVIDIAKHAWRNKEAFYRDGRLIEYITFEGSGDAEDARKREKLYLAFIDKQFPDAEMEEGLGGNIRIYPKEVK